MKTECTIGIGDDIFIKITADDVTCNQQIKVSGELSSDQLSGLNVIQEVIRCWNINRPIDRYFNPVQEGNDLDIVKLEWTRAGTLLVREKNAPTRFQHADTVEEALERNRVFTVYRFMLHRIPTRRSIKKGK